MTRARALEGAAAATALAILALAGVARLAPEQERGNLLPFFESYVVARVEVLGVSLYVDTSSGLADLLTVAALSAAACVLGVVAVLLARAGAPAARAFGQACAGAVFLALDDLLGAHETLGHNLGPLAGIPVVDHPDDLVVGLYGVVLLAFAWHHRRLARASPVWPWALFALFGTIAVGHDLSPLGHRRVEEAAEVLAGLAGLVGVCLVAAAQLSVRLEGREGPRCAPSR